MVPREKQGTRDEETVTGTGTGAGTGTRTRTGMSTSAGKGARTGTRTRDETRVEGGGKRELGNLKSSNRGGSEDARRGARQTSSHKPHSQDPTPQRDRRIMRRTRAQGREARDRIGKGGKKRTKIQKSYIRDVGNGGDLGGTRTKKRRQ